MTSPVKTWEFTLPLDPAATEPLFLQIARGISGDIERGRLAAGSRLPGTRRLAAQLEVHRNTVVAAYAELIAEGWLSATRASGTFVADVTPMRSQARRVPRARARTPGFDPGRPGEHLPTADPLADGVLQMGGGIADLRLLPLATIGRRYRQVLQRNAADVLGYGHAQGHPRLLSALAAMLNDRRGLTIDNTQILVTQGTQMALDLVANTLVAPGDIVLVEALGYAPAWAVFRRYGAQIMTVALDDQGIDTDEIARIAATRRIRAVYTTPHHQYPTTSIMSPARRLALLTLAAEHRFAIIEDDYDHEFHYDGQPVLPLASRDTQAVVVYLGTLAKLLAPGFRIGYIVAPSALIDRLTAYRLMVDRQGDLPLQLTIAGLLEDGTIARHARRARKVYAARRDWLVASLQRALGSAVAYARPPGGMAIWAGVATDIDADAWVTAALAQNVAIRAGRSYAYDGHYRPYIRLGFASLDEQELALGVRRLARALKQIR